MKLYHGTNVDLPSYEYGKSKGGTVGDWNTCSNDLRSEMNIVRSGPNLSF